MNHLGIIGCGDFLRLQQPGLEQTKGLKTVAVFDPDPERSQAYAALLGARSAVSADEIIASKEIDTVAIFVPPWARKKLLIEAACAGKHVITTKPLAPQPEDCDEMVRAVAETGVTCGVIYNRSEDAKVETLKEMFVSGRYGRLALFKQDWLHHYPSWNNWALDPSRNGGPFMDAMIHNLNIARYLMGRDATRGAFFSERLAHPDLPCADTEFLKLDFGNDGSAHLFITWAADLAVYDSSGNHREHVDIWYAITDQGWRITFETKDGSPLAIASRDGVREEMPVHPIRETPYDCLNRAIAEGRQPDGILPTIEEAREDIRIIRATSGNIGCGVDLMARSIPRSVS